MQLNSSIHRDEQFNDPFVVPSSDTFPTDIRGALDSLLYLYRMNRMYGAVMNRVCSWFITEMEVSGGSKTEQEKLREVLRDSVGLYSKLQQVGVNWAIYGNVFVRVIEPFDRWLIDRRENGRMIALSSFPESTVTYKWETMKYNVPDLLAWKKLRSSGKKVSLNDSSVPRVDLEFQDRPSSAPERFSVMCLDPRFLTLDKSAYSDSIQYIHTIPPQVENRIKNGVLHEINSTPRGLLEAVAKSKNYRFRGGEVFHFRAPNPTGVSDSGWACPELIWSYDSLYQLQVYRRADFAIARDMLLPKRVISPAAGGADDQMMNMQGGQFLQQIGAAISVMRKRPEAIVGMPFPVQMSEFDGKGAPMVLKDVIQAYTEQLFDGLGMPLELYRGTLNLNQLPNSARVFERSYEWLYEAMNGLTAFIGRVLIRALDLPTGMRVSLRRPSVAYNAEWMQLKMQLAANREIPRGNLYRDIGIDDPVRAAEEAAEEDQEIRRRLAEKATAFEKEQTQGSMADVAMMAADQGMQQAGAAGAPAPGAAPAPGGMDYAPNPADDPTQVMQRANELAMQWLQMHAQQPNSHRKEMQRCEATNPTLFAAAKRAMDKIRQQGESQGRAAAVQNAGG